MKCIKCNGTGKSQDNEHIAKGNCFRCFGTGVETGYRTAINCPKCKGTGISFGGECFACVGKRKIVGHRLENQNEIYNFYRNTLNQP